MACITFTPVVAMATTQLARATHYQVSAPWQHEQQHTERQPLRMNWVVVTDKDGNRVLRMQWVAEAERDC